MVTARFGLSRRRAWGLGSCGAPPSRTRCPEPMPAPSGAACASWPHRADSSGPHGGTCCSDAQGGGCATSAPSGSTPRGRLGAATEAASPASRRGAGDAAPAHPAQRTQGAGLPAGSPGGEATVSGAAAGGRVLTGRSGAWRGSVAARCSGRRGAGAPGRDPRAAPNAAGRHRPGVCRLGPGGVGRRGTSALGTLVERATRTTLLVPLQAKAATSVRQAFARALRTPRLRRGWRGRSPTTRATRGPNPSGSRRRRAARSPSPTRIVLGSGGPTSTPTASSGSAFPRARTARGSLDGRFSMRKTS